MGYLLVAPAMALAAALGGDYALDSSAWNGLERFAGVAQGAARCPAETRAVLDWSTLRGTDILWLVYPRHLDGRRLASFLEAGGRAVIADDFGGASDALARLGIEHREGPLPDARPYNGNPRLLVATSTGTSPLARSTPTLVTNHPAWFATALDPAFLLGEGAAAVVVGKYGRGRFAALSDPSVLINNMLELPENRVFAAALVADSCRPGQDRILLLTGDFPEKGTPPTTLPGSPAAEERPLRERINSGLEDINRSMSSLAGRIGLGLAMVVLAILIVVGVLPGQLPAFTGGWTRSATPPALGYEALVWRYGAGDVPWGRQLLASVLREEVVRRVGLALGAARPVERMKPRALAAEITRRFGPAAGRAARTLWRHLGRVSGPTNDTAGTWIGERRLTRMYALSRDLFHEMGLTSDEPGDPPRDESSNERGS